MARGLSTAVAPPAIASKNDDARQNRLDAEALASAVRELEQTWSSMLDAQKEEVLEDATPGASDPQRKKARTERIGALKARAWELRREIESLSGSSPPTPEK
jgi:hypothetical protein